LQLNFKNRKIIFCGVIIGIFLANFFSPILSANAYTDSSTEIWIRIAPPIDAEAISSTGSTILNWTVSPHTTTGCVDRYHIYYKPSEEENYPIDCANLTAEELAVGKGCMIEYSFDIIPDQVLSIAIEDLESGTYDFLIRAVRNVDDDIFDPNIHESRDDCESCETSVEISGSKNISVFIRAHPQNHPSEYLLDAALLIGDLEENEFSGPYYFVITNGLGEIIENVEVPASGEFIAYLKGRSHLLEKMTVTGVDFSSSESTELNFSGEIIGEFGVEVLTAGDAQGEWPGMKDNKVDILDLSTILTQFMNSDIDADLDFSNKVDVLDLSIVLTNFMLNGEEFPTSN
jgi:hypothetical protein